MQVIKTTEVTWHKSDNRHIFIEKTGGEITGINYMQGEEYRKYSKHLEKGDEDLLIFYNQVKEFVKGGDLYEVMNNVFWLRNRIEHANELIKNKNK